jgi:hypothetical protein
MSEFQPLIDQLYREEVERARKLTPAQRIEAAFELTDMAFSIMEAGIRAQHPEADDAEIVRLARERIALARRVEDAKFFRAVKLPV